MTTLGELIDARGINLGMAADDIVLDTVVIAECITADGDKYLAVAKDEHTNWLKEIGMLTMALKDVQDD